MAKANSSRSARPRKPRPDFPLYTHASGQWAKKIKGKVYYFGRWENPDEALAKYVHERDDLYAGRKPRPRAEDGLSVKRASNSFLTAKQRLVEGGEISPRHFTDLKRAALTGMNEFGRQRMVEDLRPDDFSILRDKLGATWGSAGLKREIANIRQIFNWCYKNDLIDRPVKFGTEFSPPNKKVMRKERRDKGRRDFTADQISSLLKEASKPMKAMIYLGINCGLENSSLAFLTFNHFDLESSWLDYTRRKTGVDRRAWLWPETAAAIQETVNVRPKPKSSEHDDLVFLTRQGRPWGSVDKADSPISKEFRKLLDKAKIYRPGLSFYSLRHTFRTVADATKDQPAIDLVMGHSRDDMPSNYRQGISDERLKDVSEFVREWLFSAQTSD